MTFGDCMFLIKGQYSEEHAVLICHLLLDTTPHPRTVLSARFIFFFCL